MNLTLFTGGSGSWLDPKYAKIVYAALHVVTCVGGSQLRIVRRGKLTLAKFELGLWLFHCRLDTRPEFGWEVVDRLRNGREILSRGMQLVDERDHDRQRRFIEIQIM